MKKLQLEISGLSYSQTSTGAYALVLSEIAGKRRLPIIIGGFEAQAIAIELENMSPTRPLTHDLFKSFADSFGIRITEVLIYNLQEGIFYARLICENDGQVREIDARTSDAIALAVRFKCPIYTFEFILSSAGIVMDDEDDKSSTDAASTSGSKEKVPVKKSSANESEFSHLSLDELQEMLDSAIKDEAYEKAGKIRDEINKRK
jgi:bifunctional DNase/RNase